MAIWTIYLGFSFFLILLFWQIPPDTFTLTLRLYWIPPSLKPLAVLLGIDFIVLVGVVAIELVCAISVAIIHTLWILSGWKSFKRSLSKTWEEVCRHEFFDERPPNRHDVASRSLGQSGTEKLTMFKDENERKELYQSLGTEDIRLLEPVANTSTGNVLDFKLTQERLISADKTYTALSYWSGTGKPTEIITVGLRNEDRKHVYIRPNLAHALRQLVGSHQRIWVDAICINQEDKAERSAQVRRMQAIFASANRVVAWISEDAGINYQQEILVRDASGPRPRLIDHPEQVQPTVETFVRAVLINPYWKRLWIIQELAVAQNIEVVTENRIIEESNLRRFAETTATEIYVDELEQVKTVLDVRAKYRGFQRLDLLSLLLKTTSSLSSERLDRVFAILSMAADGSGKFLREPSYGSEGDDLDERMRLLSKRMTQSCAGFDLQDSGPLDIILLGSHFFERDASLPSWCPNYFKFDDLPADCRLFEYVRDVLNRGGSLGRPLFQATRGSSAQVTLRENKILHSPAQPLGTIRSLGWLTSDETTNDFPTNSPDNIDLSGEEVANALRKLLLALSMRDDHRARLDHQVVVTDAATTDGYKTCTYPYIYFMLLVFRGSMHDEDVGLRGGWYARWLQANRRFFFGQQTLEDHARKMSSVLCHRGFWKWSSSVKDTIHAAISHKELEWKQINQPLKMVAQQQMRLMSLTVDEKCVIGLAHPSARLADEVFLLPGCSVPVILREEPGRTRKTLIGDAIVPGAMFGEKWGSARWHDIKEVKII